MATTLTMANLKEARNAGANMAHISQPYGQGDTPLSATEHPPTKAAIKAVADRAIAAATAIGGEGAPLPPDQAIVTSGLLADVTATGTGTKVTLTVADGKITAVTLSE